MYVKASWAGCRRTTSSRGGCARLGKHCLKAWSKTQSIIAKSSVEHELLGGIRGSTAGLGLVSAALDFGEKLDVRVQVVKRRGLSRVRHIEVDNL